MSTRLLFLCLSLIVLLHKPCWAKEDNKTEIQYKISNSSYVLETNEEWRAMVSNEPYVILYIYIYWCEHCKAFEPHWEKLAKKLNAKDSYHRTKAIKFDINDVDAPYQEWNVRNLPAIFYIRKGERKPLFRIPEDPTRIAGQLMEFVIENEREMLIKTSVESFERAFERIEKYDDFMDQSQPLAFIKDTRRRKNLESTIYENGFDAIKYVKPADLKNHTLDYVVVYSKHPGRPRKSYINITPNTTSLDLIAEITSRRMPLVTRLSEKTAGLVFGDRTSTSVYLFHAYNVPLDAQARVKEMERAATYYHFNRSFVEMDISEVMAYKGLRYFRLLISHLPIVVMEYQDKLAYTTDITENGIGQLIEAMETGHAETVLPNENNEDFYTEEQMFLVHDVVRQDQLERLVDTDMIASILVYGEDDTSKELLKTWKKLKNRYTAHPRVMVVQAKSSKVEVLKIDKVPSIILYRASAKTLNSWEEVTHRTVDDLDAFLKEAVESDEKKKVGLLSDSEAQIVVVDVDDDKAAQEEKVEEREDDATKGDDTASKDEL